MPQQTEGAAALPYTAFATTPEKLLFAQRQAVDIVLAGIAAALPGANAAAEKLDPTDRPNQVYLVDGGRGAGKTFSLLTIQHAINVIGRAYHDREAKASSWARHADSIGVQPFRAQMLRIIFPGDFTEGEMLMEQVFAEITEQLDQVIADKDRKEKHETAKALRKRLVEQVARGWYFARRFGLEAVIRDAIDYENLVENWSDEAGRAARRIEGWRSFVRDWLSFTNAHVMVILLDDSDNDESLTENILHSLRLVLDHPQIVTVLAGNLAAMRESLVHRRMAKLAPAVGAVTDASTPTAREWRRKLRREVEEYLEKVIPQQQRAFLTVAASTAAPRVGDPDDASTDSERDSDASPSRTDDFKQIVGDTLSDLVKAAMEATRPSFLDTKFVLALRHEARLSDTPDPLQRRQLESFLSWWLFGNLYAAELQPRSVRNLRTLRDYYGRPDFTGRLRSPKERPSERDPRWRKRLVVSLYGTSANFELIQRLNDDETSVIGWLRQQSLASDWRGRRSFHVNGRELTSFSYANAYIRYQLDIGMGMPFRDNSDEVVPVELLPHPIGRRNLRRFFQPRQSPRRQRRLGVARWLDHAAIPSNCLYFHDLMALPDGAFIDERSLGAGDRRNRIDRLQSGKWEAKLADEWLSTLEDDQETDADEYLARYFREIVCETLRGSDVIPSGELLNLMDPPDLETKQTRAVYEHFVSDELDAFGIEFEQRRALFRREVRKRFKGAAPDLRLSISDKNEAAFRDLKNAPRMIALYMSLASDLRRAWHAIRIHQFAPRVLERARHGAGAHDDRVLVVNKDRLRLYKRETVEAELRKDEWVSRMLDALTGETITSVFSTYDEKDRTQIAALFTATHTLANLIQIDEEATSFSDWTHILRKVARRLSPAWPFGPARFASSSGGEQVDPVIDQVFSGKSPGVLRIFGDANNAAVADARSARNFVLLMYGLAPTLPALIHANVMSRIYEAKLRLIAVTDNVYKIAQNRKGEERLVRQSLENIRETLSAIDKWAELVGQLSVLLRCVKIMALHLDLQLLFDSSLKTDDAVEETAATFLKAVRRSDRASEMLDKMLAKAGGIGPEMSPSLATIVYTEFRDLMRNDKEQLTKGLAIFPDMAPSTLFGEGWIGDLVQRGAMKTRLRKTLKISPGRDDDPEPRSESALSVTGLFGETEQWLWACNRALRKLRQVISEHTFVRNDEVAEQIRTYLTRDAHAGGDTLASLTERILDISDNVSPADPPTGRSA